MAYRYKTREERSGTPDGIHRDTVVGFQDGNPGEFHYDTVADFQSGTVDDSPSDTVDGFPCDKLDPEPNGTGLRVNTVCAARSDKFAEFRGTLVHLRSYTAEPYRTVGEERFGTRVH